MHQAYAPLATVCLQDLFKAVWPAFMKKKLGGDFTDDVAAAWNVATDVLMEVIVSELAVMEKSEGQ